MARRAYLDRTKRSKQLRTSISKNSKEHRHPVTQMIGVGTQGYVTTIGTNNAFLKPRANSFCLVRENTMRVMKSIRGIPEMRR